MGDIIRPLTITVIITAASIRLCSDSGGDDESLRVCDWIRKDTVSYLRNKMSVIEDFFIYFALYCCRGIAHPNPTDTLFFNLS